MKGLQEKEEGRLNLDDWHARPVETTGGISAMDREERRSGR